MSEAVVAYQVFILISIIGFGVLLGERAMYFAAIGWVLWTVIKVFTGWLHLLQFASIGLALYLGLTLRNSNSFPKVRKASRVVLLLCVVGASAVMGFHLYEDLNRPKSVSLNDGTSPSTVSLVKNTSGNEIDDQQAAYREALRLLELKHPALNPDLPGFRQDLVDRIFTRMNDFKQLGYLPVKALQLAVEDWEQSTTTIVMPVQISPQVPPPFDSKRYQVELEEKSMKRTEDVACHYKPVMSDDDYRVCGLNPPDPSKH
jgi:hypothetical protein